MSPAQPTKGDVSSLKRGRYVSRACIECHRRKVKCSGEQPCVQCRYARSDCTYGTGHRRKRRHTDESQSSRSSSQQDSNVIAQSSIAPSTESDKGLEKWQLDIVNRIAAMENRLCTDHNEPLHIAAQQDTGSGPSNSGIFASMGSDEDATSPEIIGEAQEIYPRFQSGTSFMSPISVLQRALGSNMEDHQNDTSPEPSIQTTCSAPCYENTQQMWNGSPKRYTTDRLREHIDVYFTCLNPHYLCIDEISFFARLKSYLDQDYTTFTAPDLYQFVALVNYIVAVVKILDEYSPTSKIPGWKEFTHGEHLLSHVIWLGRGDLSTVYCLYLKAFYCIFASKLTAASDAIFSAVRLCFQIGLHDQNTWKNGRPCDAKTGRRIFWSLYCLDRHASLVCGSPPLIRVSECRVDKPAAEDEEDFVISMPSLQHVGGYSPVGYFLSTIKWADLCSDIWDTIFQVNAPKPPSEDAVAALDARVGVLLYNLSDHLRWRRGMLQGTHGEKLPLFVYRQSLIINLRAKQLRLLLRREEMIGLNYSDRTAEECVEIATSSIEIIYEFHVSSLSRRTDRFAAAVFVSSALIPLICVLVRKRGSKAIKERAAEPFQKGLKILQEISTGLHFARKTLQHLSRLIYCANKSVPRPEQELTDMTDNQSLCEPVDLLMNLQWDSTFVEAQDVANSPAQANFLADIRLEDLQNHGSSPGEPLYDMNMLNLIY